MLQTEPLATGPRSTGAKACKQGTRPCLRYQLVFAAHQAPGSDRRTVEIMHLAANLIELDHLVAPIAPPLRDPRLYRRYIAPGPNMRGRISAKSLSSADGEPPIGIPDHTIVEG
jgi:hypothetical protein